MIDKLLGRAWIQTVARQARLARDSIRTAAARIIGSIGGSFSIKPSDGVKCPSADMHGRLTAPADAWQLIHISI